RFSVTVRRPRCVSAGALAPSGAGRGPRQVGTPSVRFGAPPLSRADAGPDRDEGGTRHALQQPFGGAGRNRRGGLGTVCLHNGGPWPAGHASAAVGHDAPRGATRLERSV